MKFKRFFTTLALSSLFVSSALFASQSAKAERAKADATDIGTVTISEVRNAISNATTMYLLPNQNYSLPDTWDVKYSGVGENDGVFINGVKQNGAQIVYAGTGSAYITFWYGLPAAAVDGDEVEFRGQFASADYSFTLNYAAQRFADRWVHALEDYNLVSLADANMPDYAAGATINTDDMGGDYTYTTDGAALPQRKGFFGITNETGSYAFQFNHQKTSTGTGWFHVLIGGQGPLWKTGHFIDFGFLDDWAATGHAIIKEMKGNGNVWGADEVTGHNSDAVPLNWNVGAVNLLEMGAIKVKNSSSTFVFFKVNNSVKWGDYWVLDTDGMTTKVCLQYANTDATVTNSIAITATEKFITPSGTTDVIFHTVNDLCPAIHDWSTYFKSADQTGIQLNGTPIGNSNWNYFKKISDTSYDLYLPTIGVSEPAEGDVLHIGGIFKGAKEVNGVKVLYKFVIQDSDFEFNGTSWVAVDASYTAAVFAQDLLDSTDLICTDYDGHTNNHDVLVGIWNTLAGEGKYASMVSLEKLVLSGATADEDSADVVEKAMARYDYLTGKYSLTNFISGRSPVSSAPSFHSIVSPNTGDTFVIIAIAAASALAIGLFLMLKKKKHE